MSENKPARRRNYRPWLRFCRAVVKPFLKKKKTEGVFPDEPCVYLCRHMDDKGVVNAFTSLSVTFRPWCWHVFTDYKKATKQFKEYTFSERLKHGKFFCTVVSPIASFFVVSLVKSARGIPVYRGSDGMRSITTLRQSLRALEEGDNLLIFPDVDYADEEERDGGEIYEGFLLVDQMYVKRTGRHVKFVPVYLGEDKNVVHSPVTIEDGDIKKAAKKISEGIYNP